MHISSQPLNKTINHQILHILHQMLSDTNHSNEIKTILNDLLTPTEYTIIAKRIAIALFLDKKRSYQNIKHTLKVSSATISSVQKNLSNPGFQLAIQKIKADQWAGHWSKKIKKLFLLER